jgi:hypothetical protein
LWAFCRQCLGLTDKEFWWGYLECEIDALARAYRKERNDLYRGIAVAFNDPKKLWDDEESDDPDDLSSVLNGLTNLTKRHNQRVKAAK